MSANTSDDFRVNDLVNIYCVQMFIIIDYSKGFGGKYGVQKDRMDKVLWSNHYN